MLSFIDYSSENGEGGEDVGDDEDDGSDGVHYRKLILSPISYFHHLTSHQFTDNLIFRESAPLSASSPSSSSSSSAHRDNSKFQGIIKTHASPQCNLS